MRKTWIWVTATWVGVALCGACGEDEEPVAASPGTSVAGSGGSAGAGGSSLVPEAGSLSGWAVVNPLCGAGDGGLEDDCLQCVGTKCADRFAAGISECVHS